MIKFAWLAALTVVFCTVAMAGHTVAVLDGTSWKVDVEPDQMAQDKGEKQFKETITFADGRITLSTPRVGFEASPYTVSSVGEKENEYTFKAERTSAGEGTSLWTGTIKGNNLEGKLIWTKSAGTVLTYTLKGTKLD